MEFWFCRLRSKTGGSLRLRRFAGAGGRCFYAWPETFWKYRQGKI